MDKVSGVPWETWLFDRAPVGFLVASTGGAVLKASPRLLAWTGLTPEQLVGSIWFDRLLTPAGRVLVRSHLLPLLQSQGHARQIALDLQAADRERIHVLVDAEDYEAPEAGRRYHCVTFVKATDRVAWERDLLSAKRLAEDTAEQLRELNLDLERRVAERTAELARVNLEMNAYIRTVTHDLRNPLQAILSLASTLELAAGPALAPEHQAILGRITEAGIAMRNLVSSLLQMALASDKPLRCGSVDLSAIAARLSREFQDASPVRRAQWDIQPGLTVQGDEGLLEAVLRNLLGNAWKYSAGRNVARIAFRLEEREGAPAFLVRDNGAGFSSEDARHLFQPFQRLHTDKEFPGIGIGLATVKRILDRHGGDIWAESAPGQGATFYFRLPREGQPGEAPGISPRTTVPA